MTRVFTWDGEQGSIDSSLVSTELVSIGGGVVLEGFFWQQSSLSHPAPPFCVMYSSINSIFRFHCSTSGRTVAAHWSVNGFKLSKIGRQPVHRQRFPCNCFLSNSRNQHFLTEGTFSSIIAHCPFTNKGSPKIVTSMQLKEKVFGEDY